VCIGVHTCLRPKVGDREGAVTSTQEPPRTAGRLCAPRTAQIRVVRGFFPKKQKLIFLLYNRFASGQKSWREIEPMKARELYSRFTHASSLLVTILF